MDRGTDLLDRGPVELQLRAFLADGYAQVVAAVALITGDRGAAEDAVQDAMVRLLADPPVEPLRSAAAWITVAACNRARTRHRRRGIEERANARAAAAPTVAAGHPEAAAEHDSLHAALRGLPTRQRQICVLHYYLDRSVADIAADLGVSDGTVKTQLHRARAALSAALGVGPDGQEAP